MAGSMYHTEDDSNVVSGRREARRSAPPVLFRLPNLRFDRAHVAEATTAAAISESISRDTREGSFYSTNVAPTADTFTNSASSTAEIAATKLGVSAPTITAPPATSFVSTPLDRTETRLDQPPKESFWKRWSGRMIVVVLAIATIYLWSKMPADKNADERMKSEGIAESDLQPSFDLPTIAMPSSPSSSNTPGLNPSNSDTSLSQTGNPTTNSDPASNTPSATSNGLLSNSGSIEEAKKTPAETFELSWDESGSSAASSEAPEMPALVDSSNASGSATGEPQGMVVEQFAGARESTELNSMVRDQELVGQSGELNLQAQDSEKTTTPSPDILESQFEKMEIDQMLASRQQYLANQSGASNQSSPTQSQSNGQALTNSAAMNGQVGNGNLDGNGRTMLSGNTYPASNPDMPALTIPGGPMMSQPIQPATPTSRLISSGNPSNIAPPAAGYGRAPGVQGNPGAAGSSMPMVQPNQAPKLPPYTPTFGAGGVDPSLNPYVNPQAPTQGAPINGQPNVQGIYNPQAMMIQQRNPQLVPVQPNVGQPMGPTPNMINTGYPSNVPPMNAYPQGNPTNVQQSPRVPQGFGAPVGWPN